MKGAREIGQKARLHIVHGKGYVFNARFTASSSIALVYPNISWNSKNIWIISCNNLHPDDHYVFLQWNKTNKNIKKTNSDIFNELSFTYI